MDGVLTDLVTSMRRAAMAGGRSGRHRIARRSSAALARGPESIAGRRRKGDRRPSHISTSQNVEGRNSAIPQLPPGSPFEGILRRILQEPARAGRQSPARRQPAGRQPAGGRPPGRQAGRQPAGDNNQNRDRALRRVNSLGSGFIIDASGIVVTNNHVISEATRSASSSTTATRLKATLIGREPEDRPRAAPGQARQAAQGRQVR